MVGVLLNWAISTNKRKSVLKGGNVNYYYINSDMKTLEKNHSPHGEWVARRYAFTSGDYEIHGEQALGKLTPKDICFMYVNRGGVVAAGRVRESWNGCSYEGNSRWIYQDTPYTEYRIPVDWDYIVVNNPITTQEIREIFDWQPLGWSWRRTLGDIEKDKGEHLLAEVMRRN